MSLVSEFYKNWDGNYPPRPEIQTVCREIDAIWDQIQPVVGLKLIDALQDRIDQLEELSREDAFRAGFRLGAGLMAELL